MLYEKVILFLHFEAYFLVLLPLYFFFSRREEIFMQLKKITELKGEGKRNLIKIRIPTRLTHIFWTNHTYASRNSMIGKYQNNHKIQVKIKN